MKFTLVSLLSLLLAACTTPASEQTTTRPSATPVTAQATDAAANFEVKATRGSAPIVSYRQAGARPVAMIDGKTVTIMLSSTDDKHILTIELKGARVGTYTLVDQIGGPKDGQARMDLITEATPLVLIPKQGELKLDELNEKSCSGSFKGTGSDEKGGAFSIEGTFTKMLVRSVS